MMMSWRYEYDEDLELEAAAAAETAQCSAGHRHSTTAATAQLHHPSINTIHITRTGYH